MPMKIEELTEEALALPNEAKALLVDQLVESLDPSEEGEFHNLWADEAQRRLRELRSGAMQAIPGEEAVAKLREKYTG